MPSTPNSESVTWSDHVDEVLGGDLTAAIAYLTPAGGAVVTAVAPVGLRDRERGTVGFTTSLGFGRKLERLRRDPRIALAYHAREHGFAGGSSYVLVQGCATVVLDPDRAWLEKVLGPAAARFMGAPKRGAFWDRWLREYYADRVPVDVKVERIVVWPDLACAGTPEVFGEPLAERAPDLQKPPKKGVGPRVDAERAARRLSKPPHRLIAFQGADGRVEIVPVTVDGGEPTGIRLKATPGLVPSGGRRAGVLAHAYRPQLVGLSARQHTGWLHGADAAGRMLYSPHTASSFDAPPNKTLLLLANGFMAKRNLKRARAATG
jgi:hypothetical protein